MHSAVSLRPASPEDAPFVAAIWWDGWRDGHLGRVPEELVAARTEESFGSRAVERVDETTVAVVGGCIAGFVMVVADEVAQVYVSSPYRGSGIASHLIGEAERQVRANGHGTAWLVVAGGNARARAFYARSGWRDEGLFDHAAPAAGGPITVAAHRYVKQV